MQNDKLGSYLNLHFIVFIWGFTAILGALITINSEAIVWYRMLFAAVFLALYLLFTKQSFRVPIKEFFKLISVGLLIALHWIFFFKAIHVSNVSVTLSIFSLGAFFTSILEPIFYGRKILWYEVFFGLIIIAGLVIILQVKANYLHGMYYALFALILGVIFTLLNGKLVEKHESSVISFYEFLSGTVFISLYFLFQQDFTFNFVLDLYGLCVYGCRKSNAKTDALYRYVNHKFRTSLRNYSSLFYHRRKRKNEFGILYWSPNHSHHSYIKRNNKK
jgi:drug/metabolite transporter (DMT)-like permease